MKKINIKIAICLITVLSLIGTMFLSVSKVKASNINVPIITSFAPSTLEDNALKLEFNPNNEGNDYSIELYNVTAGKKNMVAGTATSYTYQNLDEGQEYEVKIRVCSLVSNSYLCSNLSSAKKATSQPIPEKECPEGQELNDQNECAVVDEHECSEGTEWNEESQSCAPVEEDKECMNEGEVWNEETKACEKEEDEDEECPEGQELIEQEDGTEKCEEIKEEECDEGEKWNSESKQCEEIPVVTGNIGSISLSPTSYKYNGKKHTPSATVKDKNSNKLTKGTDYSLSYSSSTRKNVGWYTVSATGIGNYEGTAKASFKIKPIATKITSVSKPSNTKIKVVLKAKGGGMGYEVQYKKSVNSSWSTKKSSSNTITLSVSSGTKYKVRARTYKAKSGKTTMTSSWTSSKSVTTGGKAKLGKAILSTTSYTYNGSVKKPSVTVKSTTNETLKKDKDYTVSYPSGRKNVGTYTVTIKGKGNYSGKTLKPTFTINPSNGTISSAVKNNEKMTVTINPSSMSNLSYEIWYKKSTDSDGDGNSNWKSTGLQTGTTFEITGLEKGISYNIKLRSYYAKSGSYYSKWSSVNTINDSNGNGTDINQNKLSLTVNTLKYKYNGTARKPSITVTDTKTGKTLVYGTDYSVSYSNNKNVGTATITVSGKGTYVGTSTATFTIVPNSTTISKKSVTKSSIVVSIASNSNNKKDSGIKYRIRYKASGDTNYKNINTSVSSSSKTISSLKAGTTYNLAIQAYKTVNGIEYASEWSSTKNITTSKSSSSSSSKKTTKVSGLASTKSLKKGSSYTATVKLTPSNSTSDVTWSSSKTSVAKVTRDSSNHKKAKVKCLKKGQSTITAKSNGKKDTTKLTCK